jgi:transcriptional regulator of acetoin/glycerol metabolism
VLRVPPLRARREDIVLLALQILGELAPCPRLSADACQALLLAAWEGNARQLRHVLSRAVEASRAGGADEIRLEHLPPLSPAAPDDRSLTVERIQAALAKSDGVALRAAKLLGVSRTTFYNAMARLGIDRR